MKEQWELNNEKLIAVEEGLLKKKLEHKNNCWKRWIWCIKLMLYVELALFFGWSCYMILQTYRFQSMENEFTNIIRERYSPTPELESEVYTNTKLPMIFVKPAVILNKLNDLLKDMELSKKKKLAQNKATATNEDGTMHTSTQNPIIIQNDNVIQTIDVSNLPRILFITDLMQDEESTKNPMLWKDNPIGQIKDVISTDEDEEPIFDQFISFLLMKLRSKSAENIANHVNIQKNHHSVDASNEFENTDFDVTTISDQENFVEHKISADVMSELQDSKKEFPYFIKDTAQKIHSEISLTDDKNDETGLKHFIKYLFFETYELFDEICGSNKSQKILEQIESEEKNILSNIAKNEDKYNEMKENIDKNTSITRVLVNELKTIAQIIQNKNSLSSNIGSTRKKDEEFESTKNQTSKSGLNFPQPEIYDNVRFLTPREFLVFDVSIAYVSDLIGLDDNIFKFIDPLILKSDIYNLVPQNMCRLIFKVDIVEVYCHINFTNTMRSFTHRSNVSDFSSSDYDDDSYYDEDFEYDKVAINKRSVDKSVSNENIKKNTSSKQNVSKVDKQKTTSNAKMNDALLDSSEMAETDPVYSAEVSREDAIYQTPIKLNRNEMEYKYSNFFWDLGIPSEFVPDETSDLSSKSESLFDKFEESKIPFTTESSISSILKDLPHCSKINVMFPIIEYKIATNLVRYDISQSQSDYIDAVCGVYKELFIYAHCRTIANIYRSEFESKFKKSANDKERKKRMIDDNLMRQQEEVSNMLEDNNGHVNTLLNTVPEQNNESIKDFKKKLERFFQRMEISAAHIDKLYDRYHRFRKLDDDYVSNEFPNKMEAAES